MEEKDLFIDTEETKAEEILDEVIADAEEQIEDVAEAEAPESIETEEAEAEAEEAAKEPSSFEAGMEKAKQFVADMNPDKVIATALTLPGIKIDRSKYLLTAFKSADVDQELLVKEGPIKAGISRRQIRLAARKAIMDETAKSTIFSFTTGIPGGFAMAAAIPADTLQFYGVAVRLVQKLCYIFGDTDLWEEGQLDDKAVRNQLMLYVGAMLEARGTDAAVRLLVNRLDTQEDKLGPKMDLNRPEWEIVTADISKNITARMTAETAARGVSKFIPLVGGLVSGGITLASMRPMGERLAILLERARYHYSREQAEGDIQILKTLMGELEEEAEKKAKEDELAKEWYTIDEEPEEAIVEADEFEKLEKLARLREAGIITQEEFDAKKKEILERI